MAHSLGGWLESIGLSEFEAVFAQNQVDLEALPLLTEPDLKELGLPLGPRKRILHAIEALKRQAASQADAETPVRTSSLGERRQLTVMFCDLVGSTAFPRYSILKNCAS